MTLKLNSDDVKLSQLRALSHVFNRTNRVLTGEPVHTRIVDEKQGGISWTDGETIFINSQRVDTPTKPENIVRLCGVNYHEVCHVLYTPRNQTWLVKSVITRGHFQAFNILEDMRIEGFFVTKYYRASFYFTEMVLRHLSDPNKAHRNYPLIYGRKYLPEKVREAFKSVTDLPTDKRKECEDIIDQYRVIVFDGAMETEVHALNLIEKFHNLLTDYNQNQRVGCVTDGSASGSPNDDESNSVFVKGKPSTDQQNEGADSVEEGADGEAGKDKADGDSEAGGGKGEGESDGDADTDSEGDGEGSGSSSDAPEDSEPSSDYGAGAGAASGKAPTPRELEDIIQDAIDNAQAQQDVLDDVNDIQSSIKDGATLDPDELQDSQFNAVVSPNPSDLMLVRKTKKELEQLRQEFDPAWEYEQSRGLLDTKRAMSPTNDGKHIWREFREGKDDATDIEAVILFDTSSSMHYQMDDVSRGLWVMRRAFDKIGARTTIIGFGNYTSVAYMPDDKVSATGVKMFSSGGGTDVNLAVLMARRLLASSKKTHKLFICMTDGAFNSNEPFDTINQDLAKSGVLTALFYYGYGGPMTEKMFRHYAQVFECVSDELTFVTAVKKMVKTAMKEAKR